MALGTFVGIGQSTWNVAHGDFSVGTLLGFMPAVGSGAKMVPWCKLPLLKWIGCFPADTPVSTEHGLKPIQDVRADEPVWAFDLQDGEWKLRRVVETFEHDYIGDMVTITIDGDRIKSTSGHPFWVVEGEDLQDRPRPEHISEPPPNSCISGRWVDSGDLRVGDTLLLKGGERVKILELALSSTREKVYNFHVDDLHCYAVGDCRVLVHNNCNVKQILDALPGKIGKTGPIKTVPDAKAIDDLFIKLTDGAETLAPGNYPGIVKGLPDGTLIRMRQGSKSGGATMDITMPDGKIIKVHF